MNIHNSDIQSTSDPIMEDVNTIRPNYSDRTYGKRRNTHHYRTSCKRLSRRKCRINKR